MKVAKIKDTPGYLRDMGNQAIINTDTSALAQYKKNRAKEQEMTETIADINAMKDDINSLKNMIHQLLTKIG